MEFWTFLLVIFVLSLGVNLIKGIVKWFAENRKYHRILRESVEKVDDVDLEKYETILVEFEELYESDKRQMVILKDKEGEVINICPECGEYMRIVQGRWRRFLGCSNDPDCRSYKNYESIFDLEI